MQKAIKKRLFSHEKIKQQIRKKRADDTKKTVRELLRERREDLNMTTLSESECPEKIEPSSSPKDKKPLASVDDVIESVINNAAKKKEDHTDESSKDSISSKDGINHKSAVNSSEAESNDDVQIKPADIVQLPENLPSDIIGIIDNIKKAARCSTEGKVKFFSGDVNTMLLNLERKCRCLGKQSRMRVYEHLAPFVKCRKETLMKRAKNLIAVEEQKKIKVLLDRLKAAVGAIMPPLIANYELECKGVLQRKFSAQTEENSKALRMPKRQFLWNDDTRKLVKDIITLRKKCFLNEGKQKESLEKHLTEFIKTEVHVIWPEGWMSMNTLLKYCSFTPDIKKNVDNTKKPTPAPTPTPNPSDISISPSSNIISTSNISISSTSSLTITPVTTNVHKISNNEIKVKPKPANISETIISKVNNDNCSVSKMSKPLPAVDIVKTSPPDVNNIKYPTCISNSNRTENKPLFIKDELEAILIEESPTKKEEPEDLSSTVINVVKHDTTENSNNHCQIIDLTDQSEMKRKIIPKSKPKYPFEFPEKPPKPKKESTEHIRVKPKEEVTGTSVLTQIIADTLNDSVRFAQTPKTSNTTTLSNNTASVNPSESVVKKSSASSSYDYSKSKLSSEGDDIQKVMEGLKVLHKMSSPVKSNEEIKRSSPVSVIAFNKSYTHDGTSTHSSNATPHNRSSSFQDAFQKHFIPDYHLMRASQATTPPTKGSHNSISKHNHMSTKIATSSDRYLQNSNNNYAQPNSNKVKNNCSSQQSGSYNLLDDMYANLLSEYGFSKTANSKSSTQHK
ncbi:hypothetical protein ILUMI_03966 [Ignelater luminosus]|uniref:Ubinuclein middle domain-containing protein n=1 Tax=Ignelater luminosus TaxID=2038154 RepID=A0A8K0GJG1_IGNLU|nr:hypothetical protein ILUMI_03966 [Ignelater luminosus]